MRTEPTVNGELQDNPDARAPGRSSSVHRILRNGTFNLMAMLGYALFQTVAIFILARALGKFEFGEYMTLFALIMIVQLIMEVGLGTLVTQRIAQEPKLWQKTVAEAGGVFIVVATASVALFLAIGGIWGWVSAGENRAFNLLILVHCALAGVVVAATQVQRLTTGVLRAYDLFGTENLVRVFEGGSFALLVLILWRLGHAKVWTTLAMLATSRILAGALLVFGMRRQCGFLTWQLNGSVLRSWLLQAIPLGFGDLMRRLTWQLDTMLLSVLATPEVVGIYSVAYRPLQPLNFIPQSISWATFPSFARSAAEDPHQVGRAFGNSVRLLWIISIPIIIAIWVGAEPLITIVAGDEYLEAALPMRILVWIVALSFLSVQFRFLFTALNRAHVFTVLVVAVFIMEAAIELALIPVFGRLYGKPYLGACIGSLVGELFFTVAGLVIFVRLGIGGIEWRALTLSTLAGTAVGLTLWFTLFPVQERPLWLLAVALLAGIGVYYCLCRLLGALRKEEVDRFYDAFASRFWPQRRRARTPETWLSGGLAKDGSITDNPTATETAK
jgi:O-antigen/teichoic acid export membrane protein